ncbi:MAG: methyltransferase domain-containing protein [Chitinophagaceae bacterium]
MKWNTELYNSKHAFVYQYGEAMIDLLDPKSFEKILDLGCGTGELTQKIKEKGSLVYGMDSSAEMIDKAKKNFPLIEFEVMNAEVMTYHETFDAVFSNAVLHWIGKPAFVAHNIYQSLKYGGRFVAEFGGKNNVLNIVNALQAAFEKRGLTFTKFWFFPSPAEYATLLENQGFRVALVQHFYRETELSDNEQGMKDWIDMFGNNFFGEISADLRKEIINEATDKLKVSNYKDGKWFADYARLRVIAVKEK